MGAAVKVTREEHGPKDLPRLAADLKDAGHARRMQAIAFVLDGWSRGRTAEFANVDRQTLRDWIERYNEGGVGALATLTSPGRPRLLTPGQHEELHGMVTKGPDLNKDGVVRWRCVDLVRKCSERFCVPEVHPGTMAKYRATIWMRNVLPHSGEVAPSPAFEETDRQAVPSQEGRSRATGVQAEFQ